MIMRGERLNVIRCADPYTKLLMASYNLVGRYNTFNRCPVSCYLTQATVQMLSDAVVTPACPLVNEMPKSRESHHQILSDINSWCDSEPQPVFSRYSSKPLTIGCPTMQLTPQTMYVVTVGVIVVFVIVAWYYRRNKHNHPELYYLDSDLHRHIIETKPGFTSPYRPPFWLQNNHVHTFIAALIPKVKMYFKREYINLDDDGAVALDWAQDQLDSLTDTSPILIVLPSLSACADDMAELCNTASKRGYRVVVFNKRGHGDSVLATPKLQGFGDAKDMRRCVEYLRDKYPEAKIVAAGSSAGSCLLMSYLSEYGADCLLATGVCICPGYDALDVFTKPMNNVYEFILLSSLKKILKKHAKMLSQLIDMRAATRATNFRDFDKQVYCKFYGYEDSLEYWKCQNPMRNILNISVPVMCITSLDDPIFMAKYIPFNMFRETSDWLLVTTNKGGHCGFIEESTLKPWSDRLALDYVDAVLEFQGAPK
ncbi:phospholipase ABHD3-like [Haliotis rufescens]|uniref:phospholipase ABHD3-like n=1 Tax=Haliotis rufescens TaxID=6454 RepID=UPI00201F3311|nr:phospholipase ABHD3-like [Haliotis rufescens]